MRKTCPLVYAYPARSWRPEKSRMALHRAAYRVFIGNAADQAANARASDRCSNTGTDFEVGVLQTSPVLSSGISGFVSG